MGARGALGGLKERIDAALRLSEELGFGVEIQTIQRLGRGDECDRMTDHNTSEYLRLP